MIKTILGTIHGVAVIMFSALGFFALMLIGEGVNVLTNGGSSTKLVVALITLVVSGVVLFILDKVSNPYKKEY